MGAPTGDAELVVDRVCPLLVRDGGGGRLANSELEDPSRQGSCQQVGADVVVSTSWKTRGQREGFRSLTTRAARHGYTQGIKADRHRRVGPHVRGAVEIGKRRKFWGKERSVGSTGSYGGARRGGGGGREYSLNLRHGPDVRGAVKVKWMRSEY